ncbi:hypothetical protein Syun_005188 [Stephania yunnanensis]|uniref:Subtilisin n=1 Tax=Stephania yunnanensis TaxID=152371 RepID=A0AAP0L4N1_9MAGN
MGSSIWAFVVLCWFGLLNVSATNVYIVYMGERSNLESPELIEETYIQILSNLFESKEAARSSILYSYKHGFSGFAAVLSQSQANMIAEFPEVIRVIKHRILNLHTTRSWDFLQLKSSIEDGILSRGQKGEGVIIGVLDTGIWPESESFKDHGMGEVPSRWRGVCQGGEKFNLSNCNRKIIGARWYIKGYEAENGKLNTSDVVEFLSPRDAVGHGTHTSSTAAGALVENASFVGLAQGLARGGAPAAHLAMYKVCWATGDCSSADLLAAFDDAIFDGVDVLSVSLGSSPPLDTYVEDALAIGSFHAVAKGITVVCSAGNSGPYPETVINTAPWLISVAASTIDRAFPTVVTLGNNKTIMGQALYTGRYVDKFYKVVYGEDIASSDSNEEKARSCDVGSLNTTLAKGKIVLCFLSRRQRSSIVAAHTVLAVGGVGLILMQFPTRDVPAFYDVPFVQVDYEAGTSVLAYIHSTRDAVVKFSHTKTTVGRLASPDVAFFSSRGPGSLSPSILKPDIAAPGVSILASWSPAAANSPAIANAPHTPLYFNVDSGTSMSCPHISAIVALLKSIHPTWSPAALKSALVTTASVKDKYGEKLVAEGAPYKQADPFDYGSGHVNPNKAANPGLIFDMGISDHVSFLCSMGYNDSSISLMTKRHTKCGNSSKLLQANLNLPSISIPQLKNNLTVSRTVTNVGPVNSTYKARVKSPPGVAVKVKPSILSFNSEVKKLKVDVVFHSKLRRQGTYSFGSISWLDGIHLVRIPLIVRTVIDNYFSN